MQPPPGGYPPKPPPGPPPAWGAPPQIFAPPGTQAGSPVHHGGLPMQYPSGLPAHRGAMILVLGLVSVLMCQILGVVAWLLGNKDLAEMDAGRMDPSGRDLTRAGKILGMIAVGLTVLGILGGLAFLLLGMVFAFGS